MKPVSDLALERLRQAATLPDLEGTRYTLKHEIGRGGMGVVYLAADSQLNRDVALKVLHLDDASPELAERMFKEARTLALLEHPNIVPVYDFGRLPSGRLYYTMKYVHGTRLDAYAADAGNSLADRLRLFERICEAVAFAHSKGVLHRDLKPQNIMVGAFGEVLVLDWGLAQPVREPMSDRTPGRTAGTPGYMAPEQTTGNTTIDERADVFALGRVLAFLCDPSLPKPIRSVIAKATAPDPASRYTSPSIAAADVLHFLDGLPVSAHKENPLEAVARWYRNNRTLLLLVFAYAAVRFLVFFWARR